MVCPTGAVSIDVGGNFNLGSGFTTRFYRKNYQFRDTLSLIRGKHNFKFGYEMLRLNFRQVFIGERRGGVYNGATGALEPPFLKSLQESNIRPEWYNLAWAQRYTYPSPFVLRSLTQSGNNAVPCETAAVTFFTSTSISSVEGLVRNVSIDRLRSFCAMVASVNAGARKKSESG